MLEAVVKKWCRPDVIAPAVTEIDLPALWARGIRALLLDLDNTLVCWRSKDVRAEIGAWVQQAREQGFRLCIVSNAAHIERVESVARQLGIPTPCAPSALRRASTRRRPLGVSFTQAAVITTRPHRRAGGNRAMLTVLVQPPLDEFVSTKAIPSGPSGTTCRLGTTRRRAELTRATTGRRPDPPAGEGSSAVEKLS